jgi:hypothetical protein
MLIALLAVLGVDLIVLVALVALLVWRKRWVMRRPGAFRGAIRVSHGGLDGLTPRWKRGYGRWVRDVLVWTKAPFLFRNELVATDDLIEQRYPPPEEIKRLGDRPALIQLRVGDSAIEVAAHADDMELLAGPYVTGHSHDTSDQTRSDRPGADS